MNMHPSHTINALVTALNIGFHNCIHFQNSPLINFNIFLESTGYVEGSHNQKGGVSNRVCLTCDLIYEKNLWSRYVSKIYGAEYKEQSRSTRCPMCCVSRGYTCFTNDETRSERKACGMDNDILPTTCFANFHSKYFQVCHLLFKEALLGSDHGSCNDI